MAALTSCPRCDVSLLVPAALLNPTPHGRFRCPACESEVDLPEALAAVQKTVLEAIPINEAGAVTSPEAAVVGALGAVGTAAISDASAPSDAPLSEAVTTDEAAPFSFKLKSEDGAVAAPVDEAVDAEAAEDDEDSADEAEPHGSFGGIESDHDDEAASPSRHAESSIGGTIRSLVGVVLGGVIGIGGGLLILKAYQGDKFRSPIPLPNVSAYLPDWLKEAAGPAEESTSEPVDLRPRRATGTSIELPPIEVPTNLRRDPADGAPATPTATGESTGGKEPKAPKPPKRPQAVATDAMETPEPLTLPAPTVVEETKTPPTIDDVVKGAPQRTVADVSQALAAAAASFPAGPKGSVAIDAMLYGQLAAIGQTLALVRAEPQVVNVFRGQAGELFRLAVFGKSNLDAVSALGVERLNAAGAANESGAGVVVVGQVQKMTQDRENGYWVFRVAPQTDRENEVVVISPERYGMIEFDRVLLAGAVVAEPASNVVGFKGKEPQVIWAGFLGRPAQGANAATKTTPKKPTPAETTPTPTPKSAEPATPTTPVPAPAPAEKPVAEKPKTPAPNPPAPEAPATPAEKPAPTEKPAPAEKPAAPAPEPAAPAKPAPTPEPAPAPAPVSE